MEEARSEAFALCHEIRTRGSGAELDYMARSAKGQMKQAGRSGARFAFILGHDELIDRTVTVRDLRSGGENRLSRAEAINVAIGETTPV
jgi:histidyl-tRNA synthetase